MCWHNHSYISPFFLFYSDLHGLTMSQCWAILFKLHLWRSSLWVIFFCLHCHRYVYTINTYSNSCKQRLITVIHVYLYSIYNYHLYLYRELTCWTRRNSSYSHFYIITYICSPTTVSSFPKDRFLHVQICSSLLLTPFSGERHEGNIRR